MFKTDKILAVMFAAMCVFIVIHMLVGRPPLAIGNSALEYVQNGFFALMTALLGVFFWTAEDRKVLRSAMAFRVAYLAGIIAGGAAVLLSIYMLFEIVRS